MIRTGINPDWIASNLDLIGELTIEHIYLTAIAVGIGLVISFAFALLIRDRPRLGSPIIGAAGILYAVPSLALFALLTPLTGIGTVLTAEIALIGYTLLILTRNIVEGLRGVPPEAIDAAAGMGFTARQRLLRVELPLALPVIIAGIRIATVSTIGLVTVTALTGLGGLGYLIVTVGTSRGSLGLTQTLTGIVLAVVLAVGADLGLLALQRALTPWSRRRAGA
jgi:osmoprotectant transport system permease protein